MQEILPDVGESKPHSHLCENQAYCMNGGTCYLLTSLGRQYCHCTEFYEGERCFLKKFYIPGADFSKPQDESSFKWTTMLPIFVVIGSTIALMIICICIFVIARSYYKRYEKKALHKENSKRPEISRQHASVQTSFTQLYPEIEVQCNGLLNTVTISRTRLAACSATPENEVIYCPVHPTRQSVDLESGARSADSTVDAVQALTDLLTLEKETNQETRLSLANTIILEHQDPASSKCFSPNDSNNNSDMFQFPPSSTHQKSKPNAHSSNSKAQTTMTTSWPDYVVLNSSTNGLKSTPLQHSTHSNDLFDSDPEATAL